MQAGKVVAVAGAILALLSCGTDGLPRSPNSPGGGASGMTAQGGTIGAGGALAGGSGGSGVAGTDAGGDAAGIVCSLGTMYPDRSVIDPDAPVYHDAQWTQQEVTDSFAQAKAQNTQAYRAYKAAWKYSQYLQCAFCKCGCAISVGHQSAIDCYKDMHGFA